MDFASAFGNYIGIASILLFIGIIFTGIIYMIGNFLMNEKVKGWAKTEAVEIFYSGVILSIIVGIVSTGTEVAGSFAIQVDPNGAIVCSSNLPQFNTFMFHNERVDSGYAELRCHMRLAKNFLASLFYETAGFTKAVGITHSWYTYLASISIDVTPLVLFGGASLSYAPLGFLNAKNNALSFLFENSVKVLTILRFQEVFINFVATSLFPVLLSAGIILRTFMLTRKLGGLFIAIALSIYFVYPMFYVFGDVVYMQLKIDANNQNKPINERSALAMIFMDLDSLPKKLDGFDPYKRDDEKVITNLDSSSNSFLTQIESLTDNKLCSEVKGTYDKLKDPQGPKWTDHFRTENFMLEGWFSKLYYKGGVLSSQGILQTFNSILAGIDVLAKVMFFSMFFSFLSVFATIATIKGLSPMLGGDVEIAGLTHLI